MMRTVLNFQISSFCQIHTLLRYRLDTSQNLFSHLSTFIIVHLPLRSCTSATRHWGVLQSNRLEFFLLITIPGPQEICRGFISWHRTSVSFPLGKVSSNYLSHLSSELYHHTMA